MRGAPVAWVLLHAETPATQLRRWGREKVAILETTVEACGETPVLKGQDFSRAVND
jgi:hypothetical protein